MKRNALFHACLDTVPAEIKAEIDLSFAIVEKIDIVLKEKNMTQKDLAKALNKDEAEISRWMRGTHNFTIRTLAKISTVLETPIIHTV